MVEWCGIT
ncbi:peptidase M11 gametolysin domain protein, partial [Vibrio parahaemolyticus V-223/04]